MAGSVPGIVSPRTALVLNAVIVAVYAAIAAFAATPWLMLGGFLLLAVLIRCGTLWWCIAGSAQNTECSSKLAFGMVFFNLVLGLLFAAAMLALLWCLGQFWLSGTKIIALLIAVFVAYKSTFPVISWSSEAKDDTILDALDAANGSQPISSETNTTSSAVGSSRRPLRSHD